MIIGMTQDLQRENLRHLYADVAWFGVLAGSALAFLSVFAARLGASPFQIGLLTAGPAGLNLAFSLQAGRWLEGRPFPTVTFRSSVYHRLIYLLLIPIPWLLPQSRQVWGLVALVLLGAIPGTLLAIGFNAAYADLVPADQRAHVTGRRNALLALTLTTSSLVSGQILAAAPFPFNFQLVFALGAVGAVMSSYHLYWLRPTKAAEDKVEAPGGSTGALMRPGSLRLPDALRLAAGLRYLTRSQGKPLLRADLLRGPFGRVLLTFLIFYSVQHLPIPLFPVFWVRELGLSDQSISIGQAGFNAAMFLGSIAAGSIRHRLGHPRLIFLGVAFYGLYPLLTGLARDNLLFWVASLAGGVIWGLLSVGLIDYLFDHVPAEDRPAHMAFHNLVLNLGILSGTLVGPLMADQFGLRETLFISAALRLACVGLFIPRKR